MKLLASFCMPIVLASTLGCAPDIPSAQPYNADPQAESSVRRAKVNSLPASNVDDAPVGHGRSVAKTTRAIQE